VFELGLFQVTSERSPSPAFSWMGTAKFTMSGELQLLVSKTISPLERIQHEVAAVGPHGDVHPIHGHRRGVPQPLVHEQLALEPRRHVESVDVLPSGMSVP
jgi:hypothetical protein